MRRVAGISQEHMQRAKCLTHQHQCELRRVRLLRINEGLEKKREDKQSKAQKQLNDNANCVLFLCNLLKVDAAENNLPYLTMKHFAECTIPQLRTFILVRNPAYQTASKLPNKGKLDAAVAGEENLISIAYHSRAMPLLSIQEATRGAVATIAAAALVADRPTLYDSDVDLLQK